MIKCPRCGMHMTEEQEITQIRCVTSDCPLLHAAEAGTEWKNADEKTREKMRGVIIGTDLKATAREYQP